MKQYLEVGPEKNHHVKHKERASSEWLTMGLGKKTPVDIIHDINKPWPFRDDRFRLIYASHVIEHVDSASFFLSEILRILQPSGLARLSIPDARFFMELYLNGGVSLDVCVTSLRAADPAGHRQAFDKEKVKRLMAESGFEKIRFLRQFESGHRLMRTIYFSTRRNRSIYVEARKCT